MSLKKFIKNLFFTRSFFNRRIHEGVQSITDIYSSIAEKQTNYCLKEIGNRWDTLDEKLIHQSIVNRFLNRYYTKIANNDTKHYVLYYYGTFGNVCNIGDYFQTIATEKAISFCQDHPCKFVYVQRNKLIEHSGGTCVMQGWYEHGDLGFLPGDDTRAIWVGTHFTNSTCKSLSLLFKQSSYRPYNVGCRDKSTLEFCREWGISSYFSRCLTLTLPKRSEEEAAKADVVYLVDCSEEIISLLPNDITTNAKIIYQRKFIREPWQPWMICREAAENLLDEYKYHAQLVITSALHCAQPCIAMGIPVIFINPEYNERERFSSMDGILPLYTMQDLKNGKVDFNPKIIDIEALKVAMLTNLKLSLKKERSIEEEMNLKRVRKSINSFNVLNK
jgi:hypothetical protein